MKKILFVILAVLIAGACFGQGKKRKVVVSFQTDLAGKESIYKPGEKIPFKISYKCPPDYRLAGWGCRVYLKNAPRGFEKALNAKVFGKKPEWQGVAIGAYRWFGRDQKITGAEFSTKGWPEGDYCVSITALFREKSKGNVKTDVYQGSSVIFTLEK